MLILIICSYLVSDLLQKSKMVSYRLCSRVVIWIHEGSLELYVVRENFNWMASLLSQKVEYCGGKCYIHHANCICGKILTRKFEMWK